MRIVIDTNILIDGFQDEYSVGAKFINAAIDHKIQALITPQILKEYRLIMRRLIQDSDYHDRIEDFLAHTQEVRPGRIDVVIDDQEDLKFIECAIGGGADMIISSDRHLLDIGEVGGIPIRTPQEAWHVYEEEFGGSSAWKDFAASLGIGK